MTQVKDRYASVWVLTRNGQLQKVNSNGAVQDKSPPNFASQVSYSIDQTLWVIPEINDSLNNQILYSENEGKTWIEIDLQKIKVVKLSSTHLGSCFILTPQGSVYVVQKSGEIEIVFSEGTANDISVSPEGIIWIISREKKPGGGNLVYWCSYGNFALQPAFGQSVAKKISVGPEGTARIITIGGEVASLYLNRMGGLETPGGEEFAKDISASHHSNTIWAICPNGTKKRKQSVLKYWNPDLDSYMNWRTIPNIEPFKITGAE